MRPLVQGSDVSRVNPLPAGVVIGESPADGPIRIPGNFIFPLFVDDNATRFTTRPDAGRINPGRQCSLVGQSQIAGWINLDVVIHPVKAGSAAGVTGRPDRRAGVPLTFTDVGLSGDIPEGQRVGAGPGILKGQVEELPVRWCSVVEGRACQARPEGDFHLLQAGDRQASTTGLRIRREGHTSAAIPVRYLAATHLDGAAYHAARHVHLAVEAPVHVAVPGVGRLGDKYAGPGVGRLGVKSPRLGQVEGQAIALDGQSHLIAVVARGPGHHDRDGMLGGIPFERHSAG